MFLLTREQPLQKVRAIVGQFEQRLVHQVLNQVLATDVDDERHLRRHRDKIGKVLLGTDADVDTTGCRGVLQTRHDALIAELVGDVVLVLEESVWL